MALDTKRIPSSGNRVEQEVLEAGVYPARVVQIIDFGLQPQRPYKGQEKSPAYEISITYELVDEFMVDENGEELLDKPRWISETFPIYSLEADLAKSTKRYRALDPKEVYEGDFSKLLGVACNVTLVNNKSGDKIYTNVANVGAMRPRDEANCPELVNPPRFFDLDDPNMEVFNAFPKWIQEKIQGNLEFKGSSLEAAMGSSPAPEKETEAPKTRKKRAAPVEEPPFDEDDDEDAPY